MKIDYDKFHQIAGLASAHSARELMRVTKNKLREEYGALSGDMKVSLLSCLTFLPPLLLFWRLLCLLTPTTMGLSVRHLHEDKLTREFRME